MNKFLRKKFLLLSLIASLSLTGCSTNKLNNDSDTRILVEYDSSLNNENYHSRIDDLLNLDTMSCTKNCKRNKIRKEENIQCRPQNLKNCMISKKLQRMF